MLEAFSPRRLRQNVVDPLGAELVATRNYKDVRVYRKGTRSRVFINRCQ